MEDEEEKALDNAEYSCNLIFDVGGEDVRICGTNMKKADIKRICISRNGNIMGVTLKDKGDLWS